MIKGEACALILQDFSLLKQLPELYTHSVSLPAATIMHDVVSVSQLTPLHLEADVGDKIDQFLARFPFSLSK